MITEAREYSEIPIEQIDAGDHTFLISFPLAVADLRSSIHRLGVLSPLLLRDRGEGALQVVAGFRRLSACLEAGETGKIPGLVYPIGLEPERAFHLALHDNLSRGYNLIENGNILHKLVTVFNVGTDEVVLSYMPLLGLNRSRTQLQQYLSLQNLSEGMKRYIFETETPLICAAPVAGFRHSDQDALLELLRILKPGTNKLRELLNNVEESAALRGTGIAGIVTGTEIRAVTASDATRPEKLESVRKILKEMRYPVISSVESRIEDLMKSLNLPREIKIHLPPYLEGDTLKVELKFKSIEELMELAERFRRVSQLGAMKAIIELL